MSKCGLCINGLCKYCHGTLYEDIYKNKQCGLCNGHGIVKYLEEPEENKFIKVEEKCMDCVGTGKRFELKKYICSYNDCHNGLCGLCLDMSK
jgi:DnaJ-class molecular chaperone